MIVEWLGHLVLKLALLAVLFAIIVNWPMGRGDK